MLFEKFPSKERLYFINLDVKKAYEQPSLMLFSNDKTGYLLQDAILSRFLDVDRNSVFDFLDVINIYGINVWLESRSQAKPNAFLTSSINAM
jgi:hypothetical protein